MSGLWACSSDDPSDSDTSPDDTDNDTPADWGDLINTPPQAFFAADLSDNVRNGVTNGLIKATETWGNYGPVEYWVMGVDETAGQDLIVQYCTRRDDLDQWPLDPCLAHNTAEDGQHNLLSYLRLGQQAIAQNIPMTSMGWNGNRDWEMHMYSSSYPFGFDSLFDGSTPEGETKTVFHEYFHAVQQAHIYTKDYSKRDDLAGPVWFVEGGAEFMAMYATAKHWASGEMTLSDPNHPPSFTEEMRWKMQGGLQSLNTDCPGKRFEDITYSDPCSYAAYELGAWAHAYLMHETNDKALLEVFYAQLNDLGWEQAFQTTFGRSSEDFYAEFDVFLDQSLSEQMTILPTIEE